MNVVYLRKRKRPEGSGLWSAYLLGADAFGTWFYTPARSLFRGDNGEYCETAQLGPGGPGEHCVQLAPHDGWWFAYFRHSGLLHVDVSTTPALAGAEWTFEDLELDPFRRADGAIGTEDWDELATAHAAGLVSDVERDAAERAARSLERDFAGGAEPFGTVGWDKLAAAVALGLPPLTDFGDRPLS
ncbi:DUF402 domain-containing protein [Kribbella shirazensis]|uniref:DUF402 domain-containing protein n=1 Tax=Kribbella shirazensis TaxID=1105143 RepID=A0A7X5ZZL8_9ACTN|nr:DUF402 domain-containing protein [Kribbella shirazensis]NIK56316.1 hypothetical protein [Kribbella shirazensis]